MAGCPDIKRQSANSTYFEVIQRTPQSTLGSPTKMQLRISQAKVKGSIMEKPPVQMHVFLPAGRQFLINPKTGRVFQIRQLNKLKEGDPIFFRRICQVIWSDGIESHSAPIYSNWTFVSICDEHVTISGDSNQL
jgi:hypothetical protein